MRTSNLVMTGGAALLVLCSLAAGGMTSAASAEPAASASPLASTSLAQIDGLVVIGTGSVMPLYTSGAAGAPVPLPSGSGLLDAAFAPDGLIAYVVNAAADAVTPVLVDGGVAVPGSDIATGPDPVAIAVTPNGKYALVVDNHGKKVGSRYQYWVQWIDLATNTVVAHARVGISPIEIAITPNGRYGYVTNVDSGTVTPIRVASHRALRPIHVGFDPEAIAITPNGRYAYVANNGAGTVTPIRISDNKALRAIRVGSFPAAIAITPNGKYAYVTNNGSGTVSKIRISTRKVTATIRTARFPDNIVITPNGKSAYVASFDGQAIRTHLHTVTAIDLTTGTVARQITVGRGPIALAVQPGGLVVYASDFYSGSVTPITVATNTADPALSTAPWNNPGFIAMRP